MLRLFWRLIQITDYQKTLLSLPNSNPLKNRINIVITTQAYKYYELYKDCEIDVMFVDLADVLQILTTNYKNKKIFIIGGNQIYNQLLPYCSTIWLTKLKENYDCDLIFSLDNEEVIYEDDELEIMLLQ